MKKISDSAWVVFGFAMTLYVVYLIGKRFLTDHISKDNIRYAKAVIINHKNYDVNNRVTSDYSYSYIFTVNGNTYEGDSHSQTVKIGDTIEVEYDKNHPSLNKVLPAKQ